MYLSITNVRVTVFSSNFCRFLYEPVLPIPSAFSFDDTTGKLMSDEMRINNLFYNELFADHYFCSP